ncbi:hypothetical protein BDZ91DRAFT_636583, partial [Kalaharituber pfeilii]
LLDQSDIDINLASKKGITPLHCAVDRGHEDIVRLLLGRSDIDINLGDKDHKTPLYHAVERNGTRRFDDAPVLRL